MLGPTLRSASTAAYRTTLPAPQGLPFCMAGVGDLLALFRCISCRYGFGTDASCPELLGAPGRVFTSGTVCSLKGLTSLILSVHACVF